MPTCVASFMLLSTMVSKVLKVCLSLYTLLRSYLRSHLFGELLYQEVFSLHALTSPRTIDCPHQYHCFPRSILMVLKFFAYRCHCSADTELIDRKNNAINCINCVLICSEVYRQLSSPFAFETTPGQWSRCTENRMSTFCKFATSVPQCCPKLLVDCSRKDIKFFSEPGPMKDH